MQALDHFLQNRHPQASRHDPTPSGGHGQDQVCLVVGSDLHITDIRFSITGFHKPSSLLGREEIAQQSLTGGRMTDNLTDRIEIHDFEQSGIAVQ